MQFGIDKCSYIYIESGKKKSFGSKLSFNNVEIAVLANGDGYKYLGKDEDIGFDNTLNKGQVTTEYFKGVTKIWNSEYMHEIKC